MARIVPSNAFLAHDMASKRTELNSGHFLYLFVNDFDPTFASLLPAFTEASFPGYAPRNLAGLFAAPMKLADGRYLLPFPNQSYVCSGPSNETVFGWYIRKGSQVQLSGRMISPVEVTTGVAFVTGIQLQEWGQTDEV